VREKEGVHIAFPFNLPGGRIRYDVANASYGKEWISWRDRAKISSSVQGYVDISNEEYGVTW